MVKAKNTATKSDAQKSDAPNTATLNVAAPIVAPVSDTVVAVEKATKVKKVVKPTPKNVAPIVEVPTPSKKVESVKSDSVQEDIDLPLVEQSTEFLAKLQQLGALISSLKSEYRTLEKKWTRELKVSQKLNLKRKRKSGNRAPSGFVKPTRISDELAKFLGKDLGSEMARTEVTRDINKYIRTYNLQDPANGRKINADAKLSTLLKLNQTDELTYFNLQRYMSPHFAKASDALKLATATATTTTPTLTTV
jgi:chromatin remodeling complex protein RSC6